METKYVWVVKQTQAECDYRDYPIAIYDNEQDAVDVARALNKQYGRGCNFTDDWDFDEDNNDYEYDDTHYYTVESFELNPNKEVFL